MRFEAIEAIGVGPLCDEELELAAGLNVVHGLNEAGKSSWHAALIAGWLGLRRARGPHRGEDRAFLERFEPWSGAPLVAAVRLVTDDGARYRFRHNLTDLADNAVTDGTHAVVTSEFEHDGTADGAGLLGLTRDMARPTLCVSQGDVLAVTEAASGLQTQLQRAAASASRDGGTAAAALGRLQAFRREHVGSDRANATKPLRRAKDELADARRALQEAEEEHERHLKLVAHRDDARSERQDLERQRAALERAIRAAQLVGRRRELEELRELERTVEQGEKLPPVAAEETRDRVDRARQRFADRPDHTPDDGEVERLERELADLPARPEGDVEVDAAVAEHHEQLRTRRDRLDYHRQRRPDPAPAPDVGDLTPADLDRHATTLEAPPPVPMASAPPAPAATGGVPARGVALLAGAGLLSVGGTAALVAGGTVAGMVALVAAVAAAAAGAWLVSSRGRGGGRERERQRALEAAHHAERQHLLARQQQARDALAAAGIDEDDPAVLRQLAEQARAAERDGRALVEWEADDRRHQAAVEEEEQRLARALGTRGVEVGADVAAAYERYWQQCRQRRQQAASAARRRDLEHQLEAARRLAADRQARNRTRADAERQLLDLASELGFGGADLDAADRFLTEWREHQRELADEHRRVERAREALEVRLTGDIVESVAQQVEELAAAVGDARPIDDLERARAELDDLVDRLERARSDEVRLGGEVDNTESRMTSVAEVRERVERAEVELTRVERQRDVLETTERYLQDASHRVNQDIAPVLRDAVTAHLPAITRGRYDDVQVNPRELEVTVRTDGGAYRPAEHLSDGTTEQVYLLLRLGLAEHLVITGETAPLLLDDVTVQFDEHRTVAFLELCLELADARQIVLFTQEREVLDWAESHLTGDEHRLHRLSAPAASA